jgi:hypothetical protein
MERSVQANNGDRARSMNCFSSSRLPNRVVEHIILAAFRDAFDKGFAG